MKLPMKCTCGHTFGVYAHRVLTSDANCPVCGSYRTEYDQDADRAMTERILAERRRELSRETNTAQMEARKR